MEDHIITQHKGRKLEITRSTLYTYDIVFDDAESKVLCFDIDDDINYIVNFAGQEPSIEAIEIAQIIDPSLDIEAFVLPGQ